MHEATRLAVRSAVVALLGLIGIALLWRQLRRIETALRASEERYALAILNANIACATASGAGCLRKADVSGTRRVGRIASSVRLSMLRPKNRHSWTEND